MKMSADHPVAWFVLLVGVYALAGLVFAVAFVLRGAGRIDPVARKAPLRVRLLLAPGAAALWPVLIPKWLGTKDGPV